MVHMSANMSREYFRVKSILRKPSRIKKWKKRETDTTIITKLESLLCLKQVKPLDFQLSELAHSHFCLKQFCLDFYNLQQRKPEKGGFIEIESNYLSIYCSGCNMPPFPHRYPSLPKLAPPTLSLFLLKAIFWSVKNEMHRNTLFFNTNLQLYLSI